MYLILYADYLISNFKLLPKYPTGYHDALEVTALTMYRFILSLIYFIFLVVNIVIVSMIFIKRYDSISF